MCPAEPPPGPFVSSCLAHALCTVSQSVSADSVHSPLSSQSLRAAPRRACRDRSDTHHIRSYISQYSIIQHTQAHQHARHALLSCTKGDHEPSPHADAPHTRHQSSRAHAETVPPLPGLHPSGGRGRCKTRKVCARARRILPPPGPEDASLTRLAASARPNVAAQRDAPSISVLRSHSPSRSLVISSRAGRHAFPPRPYRGPRRLEAEARRSESRPALIINHRLCWQRHRRENLVTSFVCGGLC